MMRKIVLALILAVLPAWVAAARQLHYHHPRNHHRTVTAHVAHVRSNPCAKYGAGFAPINGTSTCMKIGGVVGYDAGSGLRR